MKRLIVFTCCLVLGLTAAMAEQGKGKHKQGGAGGGKGRQAQRAAGGGGGAGKHAKAANRQGRNRSANMNAGQGGGAGRQGGNKAARKAKFKEGANAEGGNVAHGDGKVRGAGRRAQVKHFDLANAKHSNIERATFRANHRIVNAEHWHGAHYVAFRNYHPAWHDHVWWTAHYPRVVLIGGGWYYWNSGFWYPAWGYDTSASFYAYDGPIYAYNDLPPDQVVANVQTALQEQGYYQGEVDGMLGPLTRAALAQYQADHGLYTTSAIDEPTMSSLGFEGGGQEAAG
jgi:hypothetical protein